MPRIISYTPSWLSSSSPGFELFNNSTSTLSSPHGNGTSQRQSQLLNGGAKSSKPEHAGPKRIIARRNTEIFVVANNQIRWSDLCMLKDDWTEQQEQQNRQQNRKWRASSIDQQKNLSVIPDTGIEETSQTTQGSYRVQKKRTLQERAANNSIIDSRGQIQ